MGGRLYEGDIHDEAFMDSVFAGNYIDSVIHFQGEFNAKARRYPARLVAVSGKARLVLGWRPENEDLYNIIESEWKWHLSHPNGYLE